MDSAGFAYALWVFSGGVVLCIGLFWLMSRIASRALDRETWEPWEKKAVVYRPKRETK
jgi:hypothetical protein